MHFISTYIRTIKFTRYYTEIYRKRRESLRARLYQCV